MIHVGGNSVPDGICQPGYYCPNGTKFAEQYACPNGTYNDLYSLYEEAQCKNCTQGRSNLISTKYSIS